MIRNIKLLRNIGTFDSDSAAASHDLKRLVLIYAENGRGKTTLAEILRSLATGDPLPIVERQRLGSQNPPHIVLECEGEPPNVVFQKGAWNRTLPNIKIFDDVFVDANVYSGLEVESHHRQNLHGLVLGDQGVALNHSLQDLVSQVGQHNIALEEKSRAIPEQSRSGFPVDAFCDLPELPDVETKIDATKLALTAASNQDAVRSTPLFEAIELPAFDTEAISQILLLDLPDLDRAAEARVQEHVRTLGEGGEPWVADGMKHGGLGPDGICPFCGQHLTGLDLIVHYRAYFGEEYAHLKRKVAEMFENVHRTHADGRQLEFERAVRKAEESGRSWSRFYDVPPIEIDTHAIAQDWNAAREAVAELLNEKQSAPLERLVLSEHSRNALSKYDAHRRAIDVVNKTLTDSNDAIREIQNQAETANRETIANELARLEATKARYSHEIAALCSDYLKEIKDKTRTESERDRIRTELEEYRAHVFPKIQTAVNAYLPRFNTGFRIDSFVPANLGRGSGSTCTYNVVINDTPIAVRSNDYPPGEPSFRNSLSAGDRNTLALALFLSSLDQSPDLAKTIVVVDDPISSLDDHRSLATVQAVRLLADRTAQVIVLSHDKRFLCNLWNRAHQDECQSLEIARNGDTSTIRTWEVSQDAITEHDQRHFLLREYAATGSGSRREVAVAIRPYLEGYLRVACPVYFPPERRLGQFIRECCQKVGQPDEVLNEPTAQELEAIVEYANRFHHDTNPAWQSEEVNDTELLGFMRRTLAFAGPPRV